MEHSNHATINGQDSLIYMDNNATTLLDPAVVDVMINHLQHSKLYGNASSSHSLGQRSRRSIEQARKHVQQCINAECVDEILFTSGGTESNNIAIQGIIHQSKTDEIQHIITSPFEHPAVENVLRHLEKSNENVKISHVRVLPDGTIDLDHFRQLLKPETKLVTIMHSNNEIGSIQPIAEIVAICRESIVPGVIIHTDASQSVGKVSIDVTALKVDLLTICSHKFHGPKGIGALYIRRGVHLERSIHGASHERSLRPGTENVLAIEGLGKVCQLLSDKSILNQRIEQMRRTRDRLYQGLVTQFQNRSNNFLIRNGSDRGLPNTLSLSFPQVNGKMLVEQLKSRLAFSTGSACHEQSKTSKTMSTTLKAIGLPWDFAQGTIRLSTSYMTTDDEIDQTISLLRTAIDEQLASNQN